VAPHGPHDRLLNRFGSRFGGHFDLLGWLGVLAGTCWGVLGSSQEDFGCSLGRLGNVWG